MDDIEDSEYSTLIADNISDDNSSHSYEPEDRFGTVKITFGLIGLSQLIPWNFLITASDYWNYKFRFVNGTHNSSLDSYEAFSSASELTSLQKYFEGYLSIATNLPFLLILILNAFLGQKIKDKFKNFWSFIIIVIIFILMTILVKINTDFHQNLFFGTTIVSIVVLSVSAALLQSSVSGIASLFPSECMHAMVSGQAVSGLFASLAQLLALLGKWKVVDTALYYFLMADVTLIISLIMFFYINSTEYFNYHKQKVHNIRRQLNSFLESNEQNYFRSIFQSIWPHLVSVMLVFWVTLSVFPAITVLVKPQQQNSEWSRKYFIPITCFLLFNISDLMGRFTGKFCPIPSHKRSYVLMAAISRIVLIPLIILCNATPESRSYTPVVFESEVYFIVFVTILGFSNGYVLINVMVNGPKIVTDHYKESAGFFLVSFMGLGLALGAFSSNFFLLLL